MIWSKEETLSREQIEQIQLERLIETVNRVYDKVPAYKKKMDEKGVKPSDIKTLKDLARLPFVTKQDMRDNYPFNLFAVPKDKLVRIHASSGTTGKPTVVGYGNPAGNYNRGTIRLIIPPPDEQLRIVRNCNAVG